MDGVYTELTRDAERPLDIYRGLACNSLMADWWSDRSPLHDAAYQGRLLHLRSLIHQGFHVDTPTLDNVSPLHEACLGGHYACAKLLLENGANVDVMSTDGITPLFNSCSSGSLACVELILQYSGSTYTTSQLASAVHEAARKDHTDCLQVLLFYGAHIDLELPLLGTPLYSACTVQAASCVELLLHSGADVHLGCERDTPLHAAVRGGGAAIVELLLDFGADGSCRNSEGKTPLDLALPNSAVRTTLQKKGPCSLSQLCRLRVRRSLGRDRLHRASSLFLPHTITDFLLYQ